MYCFRKMSKIFREKLKEFLFLCVVRYSYKKQIVYSKVTLTVHYLYAKERRGEGTGIIACHSLTTNWLALQPSVFLFCIVVTVNVTKISKSYIKAGGIGNHLVKYGKHRILWNNKVISLLSPKSYFKY